MQSGGDLNPQSLGMGDLGAMTSSCSVSNSDPTCFQTQQINPTSNMLSRNTGSLASNMTTSYTYPSSASPTHLSGVTQSSFSPGGSQVYCSGNRISLPPVRSGSCADHTESLLALSGPAMNSYNNSYMRQANFASGLERYMWKLLHWQRVPLHVNGPETEFIFLLIM